MRYLAILLAILPIIIIGLFYYLKDTIKEPKKLLGSLFLSGVMSAFLVVVISYINLLIFPDYNNLKNASFLKTLIYSFVFVALIEEIAKWIMVYKLSFHHKEFDQLYDIILYSVFVSLGFATFENLVYIAPTINGVLVALARAITAVPAHACFGSLMGYYLAFYKRDLNTKFLVLSFIVPIIIHGIYDFLLYYTNIIVISIFLLFIVALFLITILKIKKILAFDQKKVAE